MTPAALAKILDPPDPLGNETAFRKKVKGLFDFYGWRTSHTYRARSPKGAWLTPADAGFPDIIALRPPSLVVIECKMVGAPTAKDRQAEQRIWINGFASVPGVEAYEVNPAHWPDLVELALHGCAPVGGNWTAAGQLCDGLGIRRYSDVGCAVAGCPGPHREVFYETTMEDV